MINANTLALEQMILLGSMNLLHKIRGCDCPIWQFHYLGAISAYCEMAQKFKQQIDHRIYDQLMDVENQALSEISLKNKLMALTH